MTKEERQAEFLDRLQEALEWRKKGYPGTHLNFSSGIFDDDLRRIAQIMKLDFSAGELFTPPTILEARKGA